MQGGCKRLVDHLVLYVGAGFVGLASLVELRRILGLLFAGQFGKGSLDPVALACYERSRTAPVVLLRHKKPPRTAAGRGLRRPCPLERVRKDARANTTPELERVRRVYLRGPAYWRLDASLFKKFRVANDQELEVRIESVNFLNHVNLGNPDSEIGVPGNINANAGRITSTAYGSTDPQRNFQFAVKYRF